MFQQDGGGWVGGGAFVFQLHCQKAIMTQCWGVGGIVDPGPRVSTQTWTDDAPRTTHAQA